MRAAENIWKEKGVYKIEQKGMRMVWKMKTDEDRG